jgi:hypothetical protein
VLVDEKLGTLTSVKHGFVGVGAKDLNERLFTVISRLADDVQELHLAGLLAPGSPPLKEFLQSSFAVSMVEFLKLPYFIAWSFQSRDRSVQSDLRRRFVPNGAAHETAGTADGRPLRMAVLTDAPAGSDGAAFDLDWLRRDLPAGLHVDVLALAADAPVTPAASGDGRPAGNGPEDDDVTITFRPLGEAIVGGGTLRVPPLLDVLDHLEESGVEALYVTGPGPMGLAGLAGARLLHLPVSGACNAADAQLLGATPTGAPSQRRQVRYLRWFYTRLDTVVTPPRPAARHLGGAGLDPPRVRASSPGHEPAIASAATGAPLEQVPAGASSPA